MARKVKCRDTLEWSTSDVAYKAPNNKYYSSEQAYLDICHNTEMRKKCIDKMMDIVGYEAGFVMPTSFYKRLEELSAYGFDTIYDTFCLCEERIVYSLRTRSFNSEYNKMQYVMGIIKNHINDVAAKRKREVKQMESSVRNEKSFDVSAFDDLVIGIHNTKKTNAEDLLGGLF